MIKKAAVAGAIIVAGMTSAARAQSVDRAHEGDWYLVDQTDNNTGEREVYAMQLYVERDAFVTLKMRCWEGKSVFSIEWEDLSFPDRTVVTIGAITVPDMKEVEDQYVFERATEASERGLRASPDTSAKIVSAMAGAKFATFQAHLVSTTPTVRIKIDGAQGAWSRVVRHCPIKTMAVPPL